MIPLIILAIENDEEGAVATELWETYSTKMYGIAFNILKNKEDAEDAVGDAVCKIVKNIKYFYGDNKRNTECLIAIYARYSAINLYNKRKKRHSQTASLYNDEDEIVIDIKEEKTCEDIVMCEEAQDKVREALMRLSDKYRDVLILKYFHGLKSEEMSQVLNTTTNNIDVRVHRAKQMLLKEMEGIENA